MMAKGEPGRDPGAAPGSEPESVARLVRHDELVRAWQAQDTFDPDDLHAVFWQVFSRLPAEVMVHPSENYYYWQLTVDGREIRGNIRFPARERDRGIIGFAYSERKVPDGNGRDPARIARRALLDSGDGVALTRVSDGVYDLGYRDHQVRFHLECLPQQPPAAECLLPGEEFVARTCDESGLNFLLLFQSRTAYFLWVLDDGGGAAVADHFVPVREHVLMGRRTGFVFRVDDQAGGRKVLIAVSQRSVEANDYYDGPFDQLPDNHVATATLRERMIRENPRLHGKIDRFGYFLEENPPMRVALARYDCYRDRDHLDAIIDGGRDAADWREHFARVRRAP